MHRSDRLLGRVFEHEMRGLRNLHHVGLREAGGDVAEDLRMKAGIFHSPEDLHRLACECRQPGHHVVHHGSRGMETGKRDVADEAPDCLAAGMGAVGTKVALPDLLRQGVDDAERRQQFHEPHRVLREQPADQGGCSTLDHSGEQGRLREGGVEIDQPLDSGGAAHRETRADRAAPVVHHQRKAVDAQLVKELLQMADAVGRAEEDVRGLVGKTAADMIGHDHPEVLPQAGDQIAE